MHHLATTEERPLLRPSAQRASGEGSLSLKQANGRTRIAGLYQEGCAKLRFPQSETGAMEAVMINTAGGLTGGDRLGWTFDLADHCSAQLTTQACEKIYRASDGMVANVTTSIRAGRGAYAAWLPQEAILFDNSALQRRLEVDLAENAEALLVESTIFGRRAMGEVVNDVRFSDQWRIRRNGRLIHAENFVLNASNGGSMQRPALIGGNGAVATILLVSDAAEKLLEPVRSIVGALGGASFWMGKLLARLVDVDAYQLRKRLLPLLALLNRGRPLPRVWSI
ncbi:urease accessory protein UreD [Phyllobacterium sp. 0TCS1.6C]|uniref:urease accessory protein UreD n=1 Tax=unclassified Phyllobacterium TaxID=2638441 RepID=UPI0022646C58|nr:MULTISPECIES: urease accessory protein UreD [unclassified Phyllobacterium]MCX8281493.1 urease accessory protein UreD [Phyllobacterium sp. 0TCS1.6C]MCX8292911.1 urease accessory protein UreD [Phyllobacterium sp. 0TCS1.6A]